MYLKIKRLFDECYFFLSRRERNKILKFYPEKRNIYVKDLKNIIRENPHYSDHQVYDTLYMRYKFEKKI